MARIPKITAFSHRKQDAEFARQWQEAEDEAVELLHSQTFRRALEGDLEPIVYMGVTVGYIRKFSDKLQIEMLRAYRPDQFKTPGTNVNIGTRGDVFVLTEEQRHELMQINREFLLSTPPPALPANPSDTVPPHNANDLQLAGTTSGPASDGERPLVGTAQPAAQLARSQR